MADNSQRPAVDNWIGLFHGSERSPGLLRVVLATFLMCILAISFFTWRTTVTHSPKYSITALSLAIRQRDWRQFERYVDLDEIARRSVLPLYDSEPSKVGSPDPRSDPAAFEMVRGLFAKYLKEQAQELVVTPPAGKGSPSVFDTAVTAHDIKSVRYDSTEAVVGVNMPTNKGPVEIHLRMMRDGDHWRVVQVENSDAFLEAIKF